jgi:DNA-binding response OmpR family regulator
MPEDTRPTIFLIEEDNDARPHLTKNLRSLGYRLLVAADLEDAREWVSAEGYIHADLVLIDLIGKTPEEVVSIGRALRRHARYDGHTPLVVMPESVPEELEGTDTNVSGNDWISYLEDADQLRRLLKRLIPAKAA